MLSAFGTFWGGAGVGVTWPGGDASLLWLAFLYAATGVVLVQVVYRWRSAARLAVAPIPSGGTR